jgi:uncharacterized protein YbjT (DUF2867 family)
VAVTNLVAALEGSDTLVHLIRMLGMQPEANLRRVPQSLRTHGMGLPIQHPIAKRVLDDSGLPVTYLNSGATFIDNFLRNAKGLRNHRTLIWPERLIPFIDTDDIAEVAARILLSDNHRHIGQFHTMNNGQDILRFSDVARLMSEVWGVPIRHDPSARRSSRPMRRSSGARSYPTFGTSSNTSGTMRSFGRETISSSVCWVAIR